MAQNAHNKEARWQQIAHQKQKERLSAIPNSEQLHQRLTALTKEGKRINLMDIPRECGILSPRELELTEKYDATALVGMLARGEVSSVEVTGAFCKRAGVVHLITNCLTEPFFDQAHTRAQELDTYLRTHKHPMGPLHGLPISLKDTFRIRGLDASIGIASLCHSPSKTNSSLVDLLLSAGAVLYCKTNIPQTLMALDSHNNVFGRTLNPHNTLLTAGGSSGGEGVLVAMGGSVLGVGTDVGGSIRIPALCNGVFGLKPSHGRVPYSGQENGTLEGSEVLGLRASAGPIARSVRDLDLFMRVVGDMRAWRWDVEALPQGWGQQICLQRGRRLRVGVVRGDGVTVPMPPVANYLDEAVGALRRSGRVEVVEMDIRPLMKQCQGLFNKLAGTEGGNHIFDLLEATGEPLSPWLQTRIRRGKKATIDTVRDLHAQRTRLATQFLHIWTEKGGYWEDGKGVEEVDVLICPVAPHTTPAVDAWNTASYTSSFVLLDYPAATLPVREVQLADLQGEIEGEVLGTWDKANRKLWAETEKATWLGGFHCLQVVGKRREDRVVVEAVSVLEKALKKPNEGSQDKEKAKL